MRDMTDRFKTPCRAAFMLLGGAVLLTLAAAGPAIDDAGGIGSGPAQLALVAALGGSLVAMRALVDGRQALNQPGKTAVVSIRGSYSSGFERLAGTSIIRSAHSSQRRSASGIDAVCPGTCEQTRC